VSYANQCKWTGAGCVGRGGGGGDVARFRDLGARLRRSRRLPVNGWTSEEVERRICDEEVEWADVFDHDGRQVLRKRGTADGVFFVADELPLLKDALLVHNHPPNHRYDPADPRFEGGSFSERDLDLVLTYDIAELRAVTPGWRYVIVRPPNGWIVDPDSATSAFREQLTAVDIEDERAILEGTLSEEEADGTRVDRAFRRVAAWGGFAYRRETI
jgi:hypothetical protein